MSKTSIILGNTVKTGATVFLTSVVPVAAGLKCNNAMNKMFDDLASEVYPKKRFGIFKVKPKRK